MEYTSTVPEIMETWRAGAFEMACSDSNHAKSMTFLNLCMCIWIVWVSVVSCIYSVLIPKTSNKLWRVLGMVEFRSQRRYQLHFKTPIHDFSYAGHRLCTTIKNMSLCLRVWSVCVLSQLTFFFFFYSFSLLRISLWLKCPDHNLKIARCAVWSIQFKESYDDLKVCASPVFPEFNDLLKKSEVTVDDEVFSIDLYFNGDMKFIGICLGLNSACSNYASPWCVVDQNMRMDISKDVTLYESVDMARTADNLNSYYTSKQFGCKNKSLIEIEPRKVVLDELHLFLRIYDILMGNLLDDCRQLDNKAEVLKQMSDHMDRLVRTINDCGVKFNVWTDKSGNSQTTSLTGGDYKKLAKCLPDKLLFIINNETHDEVVFLWRELSELQNYITQVKVEIHMETVYQRVKKWLDTFLGLEMKGRLGYSRVTPYMHCLLYHVPGFVNRYGTLLNFSGQGVENMNDIVKMAHQKRSNKHDQTVEELKTRKRMEVLKEDNCERGKRTFSKSNENYWNQGYETI